MLWKTPDNVESLPTYRSGTAKKSNSPGKTGHLPVSIIGNVTIHLIFWANTQFAPGRHFALTIVGFVVSSAFNYILSCDEAKKKHSGLCWWCLGCVGVVRGGIWDAAEAVRDRSLPFSPRSNC